MSTKAKAAEAAEVVVKTAKATSRKSGPAVKKASKAATDAAASAATFVFEATRAATRKVTPLIYGPPCPRCGERTVIKVNRTTHQPFAACSAWDATGCGFTSRITFIDEQ